MNNVSRETYKSLLLKRLLLCTKIQKEYSNIPYVCSSLIKTHILIINMVA